MEAIGDLAYFLPEAAESGMGEQTEHALSAPLAVSLCPQ